MLSYGGISQKLHAWRKAELLKNYTHDEKQDHAMVAITAEETGRSPAEVLRK